jgi:hypothetical protein
MRKAKRERIIIWAALANWRDQEEASQQLSERDRKEKK